RMLNASKGPAVWGPRAQADRKLYRQAMQNILSNYPNLELLFTSVEDIHLEGEMVSGITTGDGTLIQSKTVILTTGTFLDGLIHIGQKTTPAGRMGERPSIGLSDTLKRFGFTMGRLKTGTPPRLDKNTIHWEMAEAQPGDNPPI